MLSVIHTTDDALSSLVICVRSRLVGQSRYDRKPIHAEVIGRVAEFSRYSAALRNTPLVYETGLCHLIGLILLDRKGNKSGVQRVSVGNAVGTVRRIRV